LALKNGDVGDLPAVVREAMQGCRQAFDILVERYSGLVYHLLFRIVGGAAGREESVRDLCQDVFLKAFTSLRSLRDPEKFPAWLATMTRRLAIDHLRRKGPSEVSLDERGLDLPDSSVPDPSRRSTLDRRRELLEEAIGMLGERDRSLITLAYFDELRPSEVAGILSIPEGNLRVYLHRARRRLRELLRGKEDELLTG
jgi:RNA polymerase sigma-70 factor (ECF subfamily)